MKIFRFLAILAFILMSVTSNCFGSMSGTANTTGYINMSKASEKQGEFTKKTSEEAKKDADNAKSTEDKKKAEEEEVVAEFLRGNEENIGNSKTAMDNREKQLNAASPDELRRQADNLDRGAANNINEDAAKTDRNTAQSLRERADNIERQERSSQATERAKAYQATESEARNAADAYESPIGRDMETKRANEAAAKAAFERAPEEARRSAQDIREAAKNIPEEYQAEAIARAEQFEQRANMLEASREMDAKATSLSEKGKADFADLGEYGNAISAETDRQAAALKDGSQALRSAAPDPNKTANQVVSTENLLKAGQENAVNAKAMEGALSSSGTLSKESAQTLKTAMEGQQSSAKQSFAQADVQKIEAATGAKLSTESQKLGSKNYYKATDNDTSFSSVDNQGNVSKVYAPNKNLNVGAYSEVLDKNGNPRLPTFQDAEGNNFTFSHYNVDEGGKTATAIYSNKNTENSKVQSVKMVEVVKSGNDWVVPSIKNENSVVAPSSTRSYATEAPTQPSTPSYIPKTTPQANPNTGSSPKYNPLTTPIQGMPTRTNSRTVADRQSTTTDLYARALTAAPRPQKCLRGINGKQLCI